MWQIITIICLAAALVGCGLFVLHNMITQDFGWWEEYGKGENEEDD